MSQEINWSEAKLTKLIKAVKDHPCLWDSKNCSFNDIRVRNAAWAEISDLFECATDVIQQQWCNVRSQYRKARTSAIKNGMYLKAYCNYHKSMSFLDDSDFRLENSLKKNITKIKFGKAELFEIPESSTLSEALSKDHFSSIAAIPTSSFYSAKNERPPFALRCGKKEKLQNINTENQQFIKILPRQQVLSTQFSKQLSTIPQNQHLTPIIFIPNSANSIETKIVSEALEKHNETPNTISELQSTKIEKITNPQFKEQDSITIGKPTSIQKFMLSMADQLADLDSRKQREAMIGIIQTIKSYCDS